MDKTIANSVLAVQLGVAGSSAVAAAWSSRVPAPHHEKANGLIQAGVNQNG